MDESKPDCTLTNYGKISDKDFRIMAVREMSRQYVDKTNGQVVWKQCPEIWPFKKEEWKNPTSTPKDSPDLLMKKYKFFLENVPQDKFSEFQKCCFEMYENEQMDELSNLVNLEKIKEQLISMDRFMSKINCSHPMVHSKVMEVKTLMNQLCANESIYDASLKRKGSTATSEPVKKKRHSSPSLSPSTERTLSCPPLRLILPKRTPSKTDPQNHTTAKPSKTVNILTDCLDPTTCTLDPKYCFSDQDYHESTFSMSNCPASQPETNESTVSADHLAVMSSTPQDCSSVQSYQEFTSTSVDHLPTLLDANRFTVSEDHSSAASSTASSTLKDYLPVQDHQGITLSTPNSPSDENRTDIAEQLVLQLSPSKYCLSVQDNSNFPSSSLDLLASALNVNRANVSADPTAATSSTLAGCLSPQVHQESAPSNPPDESDQCGYSENEGLCDTHSTVQLSPSVDSGRSSVDASSDSEGSLFRAWILDEKVDNLPKNPKSQALFEKLSALP